MCVTETARAAPAIAGSDPRKSSCLAADDFEINPKLPATQTQNPVAVAAPIVDLTIEASIEAVHIASVASQHFVENAELGDFWAADHSLGVAVEHPREAAARFRKWQALKAEGSRHE